MAEEPPSSPETIRTSGVEEPERLALPAAESGTEEPKPSPPSSEKVATEALSKIISGTKVTSPIIGTAYHSPEPGAKKFIEVGKKIKKGETIMIVEAMKTMNHVPSTAEGIVREICVEDGQPVEFGQTIIILD